MITIRTVGSHQFTVEVAGRRYKVKLDATLVVSHVSQERHIGRTAYWSPLRPKTPRFRYIAGLFGPTP